MKRMVICFEMLPYSFLQTCNTPNIDSLELGPHPAKSLGGMTRAAVPWLLGGFTAHCLVKGCRHNKGLGWGRAWYLTDMKAKGIPLFLYVPNGWVLEFLTPFMSSSFKDKLLKWHDKYDTKAMIEDFLEAQRGLKEYFAYIHIMETHMPFFPPNEPPGDDKTMSKEELWGKRRRTVEYMDSVIKPLIDLDSEELVITSDHNIALGEWSPEWFDVFIATRGV